MSAEARTAPRPSARPRYRYVLFRILRPSGLARADLIAALRRAPGADAEAWLTRYDGDHGVLRCPRGREAAARALLEEGLRVVGVEAETLSTSGTLAALERRHPPLRRAARAR